MQVLDVDHRGGVVQDRPQQGRVSLAEVVFEQALRLGIEPILLLIVGRTAALHPFLIGADANHFFEGTGRRLELRGPIDEQTVGLLHVQTWE